MRVKLLIGLILIAMLAVIGTSESFEVVSTYEISAPDESARAIPEVSTLKSPLVLSESAILILDNEVVDTFTYHIPANQPYRKNAKIVLRC